MMDTSEDSPSTDAEAVKFWNESFGEDREVAASKFANALVTRFKMFPEEVIFKAVDHFIAHRSDLDVVTSIKVKEWVNFLERFGPFQNSIPNVVKNFFDRNGDIHCWYHLSLDREHARRRMRTNTTFLLRESTTKPNGYVLMYSRVEHGFKDLLLVVRQGQFAINPDNDPNPEHTDNLPQYLRSRCHDLTVTPSMLYQSVCCAIPERKDRLPPMFDSFQIPSNDNSVQTGKDYQTYEKQKAEHKKKADVMLGNYVMFGTGQSIQPSEKQKSNNKHVLFTPPGSAVPALTPSNPTVYSKFNSDKEEKYPAQPRSTASSMSSPTRQQQQQQQGVGSSMNSNYGPTTTFTQNDPLSNAARSTQISPTPQTRVASHSMGDNTRGGLTSSPPTVTLSSSSLSPVSSAPSFVNDPRRNYSKVPTTTVSGLPVVHSTAHPASNSGGGSSGGGGGSGGGTVPMHTYTEWNGSNSTVSSTGGQSVTRSSAGAYLNFTHPSSPPSQQSTVSLSSTSTSSSSTSTRAVPTPAPKPAPSTSTGGTGTNPYTWFSQ